MACNYSFTHITSIITIIIYVVYSYYYPSLPCFSLNKLKKLITLHFTIIVPVCNMKIIQVMQRQPSGNRRGTS